MNRAKIALPTFEAPPAPAPVSIPRPLAYHVIVEPLEPDAYSAGGIALSQKTRRANRATGTIGTLKAVGQFAWQAKTAELDWSLLQNPPKVGELVIFRQHAGQKLRLRVSTQALVEGDQEDEQYLLLLDDTDIIGTLTPEEAKQFYSWV
jgi:co-chaperonin GroES (HSP10)